MGLCDGPDVPDPKEEAVKGVLKELDLFPDRRKIEVAALLGIPVEVNGETFDFTGLGEADYQREYSRQIAEQILAVQEKYGEQFVEQRLAELDEVDPEGRDMRQRLFSKIKEGVNAGTPDRQLAEQIQQSVMDELNKEGGMDDHLLRQLKQQVRGGQVARGNFMGAAPIAQEARAVAGASEQIQQERQQRALMFLTTGVTPEDVEYRRRQQNLQNLGSFIQGQTPVAQFQQLSGAQAGTVPFEGQIPQSRANNNAGADALNFANAGYQASQNYVNPYIAGASLGMQGVGAYAAWGGFNNQNQSSNTFWGKGGYGFSTV